MNTDTNNTFKQMPFKKKISHIFYYYKWHMIITAALIIFCISLIHGIVTDKKLVFETAMINSNVTALDSPTLMSDFSETVTGFDPEKERMNIEFINLDITRQDQSTLGIEQKLLAMIAAEEMDCMIAPEDIIQKYASVGAFTDLREIIPEDRLIELEKNGFKPYYFDIKDEETNSITRMLISIEIKDAPVIKNGFASDSDQNTPYFENNAKSVPYYSVIINSNNKNRAVDFLYYLTAQ